MNNKINFQLATLEDAPEIAKLHIKNWQSSYRGSWSDDFLDNIAPQKQLDIWTNRLSQPKENQHIILAKAKNQIIGFACTQFDDDPTYGALLDNLHVDADWRGYGIGKQLTLASMDWVRSKNPNSGYYLWVLEKNLGARKFYESMGGEEVETIEETKPDLGTYTIVRCFWERLDFVGNLC